MIDLAIKTPKRLFTFGCSFTDYRWDSWANILAYDLDCEFYNFGRSGAGNQYIASQLTQADNVYNFNKNDLVIVCWTNISREDRYNVEKGWLTPGNIYSQDEYDNSFVKKYANDLHFGLRDFSTIKLVKGYLENKTNYHFLSMCNVSYHVNQWENSVDTTSDMFKELRIQYLDVLKSILPSFYTVLWKDDIDIKWQKNRRELHKNYSDGHPTILEHFEYLKNTFNHDFNKRTYKIVKSKHKEFVEFIRTAYAKTRKTQGIYQFPQSWQDEMMQKFKIKSSIPMISTIIH